jgi:hypothetical protein
VNVEFANVTRLLVLNVGVFMIILLISEVEVGKHETEVASEPSCTHKLATSSYLYLVPQKEQTICLVAF